MPEKGASTSAQLGQPPVKKPTLGATSATDALNFFTKDKIDDVSTCQFCKLTYSSSSATRALKHIAGRGKGIAPCTCMQSVWGTSIRQQCRTVQDATSEKKETADESAAVRVTVERAVEESDHLQATVRSDVWTSHMLKPKKVGVRQSGASASASTSKAGRQSKPSQKAAQAADVEVAVAQEKSAAQKVADQVEDAHDAVLDEEMWVKMEFLVDVCKPIIMLLRFCDSDALGISKLYYRCNMLRTWIKACNGDKESIAAIDEYSTSMLKAEKGEKCIVSESDLIVPSFEDMEKMLKLQPGTINKQLMGIVRKRWDMLHTPLHAAAYVLDLEYHGQLDEICNNEEVMSGFEEVLKRYASTVTEKLELRQEWSAYQHMEGVFCGTNELMWTAARTMPAYKWWYEFARGSKKRLPYVSCQRA
eukprot:363082-Chlamydomonas_euryale.AAC.2